MLTKQRATNLEVKLGKMKLRLIEAESIISARDREVADLKVALEESNNKFYDMGFTDDENLSEPVMFQSRRYGFYEGWMAAMNAIGVPEESLLRILEQIPYPKPPPVQNLSRAKEEESQSMKELVTEIDSHAELIDLEISSDPNTRQGQMAQPLLLNPNQVAVDANPRSSKQPQEPIA